jgi:Ca-activated chloride channel homolog
MHRRSSSADDPDDKEEPDMTRSLRSTLGALLPCTLALALAGCPAFLYGDDDDGAWTDEDDWTPSHVHEEEPPDDEVCVDAVFEPVVQYVSADDSNSQADPTHVRQLLMEEGVVPAGVKRWEYLNYFDFDYEPAQAGTLRIVPQLQEDPDEPGLYHLLVGVVAPHLDDDERPPVNLTFSVDCSGSMGSGGLHMAKETMRSIAGRLREGDRVSIVSWDTENSIHLADHAVVAANDSTLMTTISSLTDGGATDLEGGLAAAYQLAEQSFAPGWINRVVLLSDGGANTGITSEELIAEHAEAGDGDAIWMVGVGVPPAYGYNDQLMDTVTDLGRGAYIYVDSSEEAERAFEGDRFLANLGVAALEVQLAITLPPGFVVEDFAGEEISTDPDEVRPQHLAPNDQMLYHLVLRDCSGDGAANPELLFDVTWVDPATGQEQLTVLDSTVAGLLAADRRQLVKADAILAFAGAFAEVADLVGADARDGHLDEVEATLQDALASFPGDPDLQELLDQVSVWRALY